MIPSRLLPQELHRLNTIFRVGKVKTVIRYFGGAGYENHIDFLWLALVFLICDMPQMGTFL